MQKHTHPLWPWAAVVMLVMAIALTWYRAIQYANVQEERLVALEERIARGFADVASSTAALAEADMYLGQSIAVIEENLSITKEESKKAADVLSATLTAEQEKAKKLEEELKNIEGTVGTLEKLREIDSELLMKYSKIFFLNEHYVPARISDIKRDYLYSEASNQQLYTDVLPFLYEMLDDAADEGIDIYVKSAHRSFGEQADLKSTFTVLYGEGANKFSADQGYSEHQLGTTVDLITPGIGGELDGFGGTEAYQWLLDNAHMYGFTLSYPEGNQYYIFEPWHWRFVGVELATELRRMNRHFYDVEQRVLDEYLISIFD